MLKPCTPTISTGPCPPTVAGPYAAWMPRKSLHGRTCGVSRNGGRARVLQPSCRSAALQSGITQSNDSNRFPIPESPFPIPHSHPAPRHLPWQIELPHD
ncbi:hypothetical protein XarjCFBP7652_01380 [Xanthomonas arboricola]|nr:hypothetical protein XarjCFBP7652_01380 [Xanthomonas arboricola]